MFITKEYDFEDLMKECSSGAISTLKDIRELEMEDELMDLLETCFECQTLEEINNFLKYERDYILETLGIPAKDE